MAMPPPVSKLDVEEGLGPSKAKGCGSPRRSPVRRLRLPTAACERTGVPATARLRLARRGWAVPNGYIAVLPHAHLRATPRRASWLNPAHLQRRLQRERLLSSERKLLSALSHPEAGGSSPTSSIPQVALLIAWLLVLPP